MEGIQHSNEKTKAPLNEEERKALSRKRVFWGVMAVNLILVALILFEIIYIFVG